MSAVTQCYELSRTISGLFCDYTESMFVQVVALVLALFTLDLLLLRRVRAIFRYWIWMIVVVKLMVPPSFSAPTGVAYWCMRMISVSDSAAAPKTGQPDVQPAIANESEAVLGYTGVEGNTAESIVSWRCGLAGLWLIGVLGLSGWVIRRISLVHKLLQNSRGPDGELQCLFEQCRAVSGSRWPVSLRITRCALGPGVFGVFRPVILVPQKLIERLDRDQLRMVLLHELMHVARGDLLIHAVQVVLQIIHFYNPLVWLANMKIHLLREQAVDEAVLVSLRDPGEYSHTLVEVAALSMRRPSPALGLLGLVESRKVLSQRLSHILSRPVPRSGRLGAVGFATVLAIAAACVPMSASRVEAKKPADEKVAAIMPVRSDSEEPAAPGAKPVKADVPATQPVGATAPVFRCDETSYDFKEAWDSEDLEHTFTIYNAGDAPLEIEAKPACGCTVTKHLDKSIAPKAKGELSVVFKTSAYRGSVRKMIQLTTNDPANPKPVLVLVGNVRARISMDPPAGASWGRYAQGMPLTRTIRVTNNLPGVMKLQPVPSSLKSVFAAEVKQIEFGKTAEVTVIAKPPFAEGVNAATLTFATGIAEKSELTIPCSLMVPLAIEAPQQILVPQPVTTDWRGTARITANDGKELKITSITTEPTGIRTELTAALPDKAYLLTLIVPAGTKLSGPPGSRITIHTNRPDKPELQMDLIPRTVR